MSFETDLVFDRLRHAHAPNGFPLKDMARRDPGKALLYLPADQPLDKFVDLSQHTELMSESLGTTFFQQLDFSLAQLTPTAEVASLRQGFAKGDPPSFYAGLKKLKIYLDQHPGDEEAAPMFRVLRDIPDQELPPVKKATQEKAFWPWSLEAARYLSMGILFQPRLLTGAYAKDATQAIPLPDFIQLFKTAEAVYGKKWQQDDADGLRMLRKTIACLEWETSNPLFDQPETKAALDKIIRLKGTLVGVADEGQQGNVEFSWPFFLKKLWDDEDVLRKQFLKLPYDDFTDNPKDFVNDPRFGQTLYQLGRTLAPITFDPKNDPATASMGQIMQLAKDAIEKWGEPWRESDLYPIYMRGVRDIQWNEILAFKAKLETIAERPDTFKRAHQLTEGYFKDFFLYESWKRRPSKTAADADRYLEKMQSPADDGAKLNRSTDLMNRYVKDNYQAGTWYADDFRKKAFRDWFEALPPDRKVLLEQSFRSILDNDSFPTGWMTGWVPGPEGNIAWDAFYQEAHRKQKTQLQERWTAEKWLSPKLLYTFSDAISRQPSQEVMVDKSYSAHILTEVAGQRLAELGQLDPANDLEKSAAAFQAWLQKRLPEACMLRDFYLENILNLRIWSELQRSSLGPHLDREGIRLETTEVDLTKHLAGKDDGVLQDAYFTKYVTHRVVGLAAKIQLLPRQEQEELADLVRDVSQRMTPPTAEVYDRVAIELESERIRRSYYEMYGDAVQRGQTEQQARNKAFDGVLTYVIKRFPQAGYNRDDLLQRFALDFASQPEHARRLEQLMYDYLVRQPQREKDTGDKVVAFAPQEAVKNYLTAFSDREKRGQILAWICGAIPPDDRYLEGRDFLVNADEEREIFWGLSDAERRVVLYHALLGQGGLFDLPQDIDWNSGNPHAEAKKAFLGFLESFFEHNLAPLIVQEDRDTVMPKVLRTIFFEVFKGYSAARRVEFFFALTKKLRELRVKNEKLSIGQAVKLFLEQVGVVGIKAGQVLAEHRDLVRGDIQKDLSSLRDKAAPFAKYGVFTDVKVAGLSPESKQRQGPYVVTEVGDCLGSASIKQSHKVLLETNPDQLGAATERQTIRAVGKFPRPSIDKNFQEDVRVLERVLTAIRAIGVDVPAQLLEEIVQACRSEFDFEAEAEAQQHIGKNLKNRSADIALAGRSLPLVAPKVLHVLKKEQGKTDGIQLLLEEYIPGLNFSEVEEYQALCQTPTDTPEQRAPKEALEDKIGEIYGDRQPLMLEAYRTLPILQMRAQVAVELLTEIIDDGIFHSDLHSGNSIIDLTEGDKRLALIDFGSVGRSLEETAAGVVDHREKFQIFLQNILLLRFGLADGAALGEVLGHYVQHKTFQAADWSRRVTELGQQHAEVGRFFKELLSELMSQHAEIHPQFRLLLKALAAAGAHLDALAMTIKTALTAATQRAAADNASIATVLFEDPIMQKLQLFLQRMPALASLIGGAAQLDHLGV